jgi:hypothetical protein
MARRLGIAFVVAIAAYGGGAVAGGWLVASVTSNTHDASLEGVMTGAFLIGPLVALVAFVIAFVSTRPRV